MRLARRQGALGAVWNGSQGLDPAPLGLKWKSLAVVDDWDRRMRIGAVLLIFLIPLVPVSATAQNAPTLLQQYSDWEAYRHEAGGARTCYVLSKPKTLAPTNRNHGDVFFFVTARPSENVSNEVSVLVGYPFAPDSRVTVDVDGRTFDLFTKDDGAWVEVPAEEQQLVAAMRAGRSMTVRGQSARGTNTTYTFSLSGVTAGTNRIQQECSS
ncbi:MAG: invasion associated locus B family protein [Pseudomonadota bacterium]